MKVAIYARVSTDKQEVENQIKKLKEYVVLREWELVDIFQDEAISGKKASRPQLNKMKEHIKRGKIKGVLVWKLDRIGRSLKDLIVLMDYFSTHHCQFISYQNNIDTSTSEGRLIFHILGAFAEFEAALISERTRLSYETKKKRAKQVRQKVKWGRKQKELSGEEIELIQKRREEKVGWRTIAKEINDERIEKNNNTMVSYNKLRRLLQNG